MAPTNRDRVGQALDLLRNGLAPFVQREFDSAYGDQAQAKLKDWLGPDHINAAKPPANWDVGVLLRVMWSSWNAVFSQALGQSERSLISELRDARNKWAHQEQFSTDDTYRVLDSSSRLLTGVAAPETQELEKMKNDLLRLRYDEQVRNEKRKVSGSALETGAASTLKPWREIVTPHVDVSSGNYGNAEFAADLWQVHLGEGAPEYSDPVEFFRRTFLTESLSQMLSGAIRRLSAVGGDPVVQLQTNFGGGKTHSMLALFHLFSGADPNTLMGVDAVLESSQCPSVPKARRVVLVGNKISPGRPEHKPDGTVVRTLWGELAYQLGGPAAYARIAEDDERATSPGDILRSLFVEYGPCLILVDEWVAYARQLHERADLPGGSFETQFSFAQALTESAKGAGNCLLVISLPASDTTSPHAMAEDIEVGGERGRQALDRLRNVIGRVEASWRPATSEEGFEIVRRRLFQPLTGDAFKDRDVIARSFADLYRSQSQEFPHGCGEAEYERRIQAAYPIHPLVFDMLYNEWSQLAKFQRTRGVLRLMAAVIHSLWEKGDRNPLILPSNIPIDDPRVQFELTRYLDDRWQPVIDKDVDGPNSLPLRIDAEFPNVGKLSATRRVARTIYLGSAPGKTTAHRGIEDRSITLGCVTPGEPPAVFSDALRRLVGSGTHLYQDGNRYWYDTQPTVSKLADDRAEQYKRNPDRVFELLSQRVKADLGNKGDFNRVHAMPSGSQDVADDADARLVVLSIDHPYTKDADNAACKVAEDILKNRGNQPRIFQNSLIFLAPDGPRLQDLDEAARKFLAWDSICRDAVQLDLTPQQQKQAEAQRDAASSAVNARVPETYQWLLVPTQMNPQVPVTLEAFRLTGSEPLAARASRKLRADERLITQLAGTVLRIHIDRVPLWRGNHVAVRQLAEDFGRYLYLPRLQTPDVLARAMEDGFRQLIITDTFAWADSYDEATDRYLGLSVSDGRSIADTQISGLLVKPDIAQKQIAEDRAKAAAAAAAAAGTEPPPGDATDLGTGSPCSENPEGAYIAGSATAVAAPPAPKRFHGSIKLDPTRPSPKVAEIAAEILAHLTALPAATVTVSLEIEADIPDGAPETVVRTVTENSRTLGFDSQGFETD